MQLITDTGALGAFCSQLAEDPFIAVDTEFMRERTFWPKLCLVQVAGPSAAAAIDPLAEGIELKPLLDLLIRPEIVKVFHAARQDLEIFYQLIGDLPAPVFDTQVAAMVCGFGDQVGYETLAARLARAKLDKASRFTDWSVRPLSQRQIEYALSDVTHLREIYRKLKRKLEASRRSDWLAEEMATLTDPATYRVDPMDAYRRLKTRAANGRFLAILREVTAWREREAQHRDAPRAWVLRDEALMEIAHHAPTTADALARTRGLGRKFADGQQGAQVLAAVRRGLDLPEAELPVAAAKRETPRGAGPIADLLKVLLKLKCEEEDVAQRLVASADDLEALAALGEAAEVAALHGWRRLLFGEDALRLRNGGIGLAVCAGKLAVIEVPDAGGGDADAAPAPASAEVIDGGRKPRL
ncbi:MAG: ribonuclease D [Rhodospirillales bacterium]|nr:ribonuclease D [Rhodospirillales bacterium]